MLNSLLALGTPEILTIVNSMLLLFGGVAAFIIGMNMMGANLETAAGKSMRRLMAKATKNRFVGVATGAAVTAIVTSSSATTVMIVGFVNVGLMTLTQAVSIIMGANIGTTVTAFMAAISTSGAEFQVTALFAFVAFVGVLMTIIAKKDKIKRIGAIFQGLGLIFIGMNVMSASMGSMLTDPEIEGSVISLFIAIGGEGGTPNWWQIIVLFLLGAALTGLVQSSSAITAIVISLASSGLISLPMAYFGYQRRNMRYGIVLIVGNQCKRKAYSYCASAVQYNRQYHFHNSVGIHKRLHCGLFKFFHSFDFMADCAVPYGVQPVDYGASSAFVNYLVKLACLLVHDKKSGKESGTEEYDMLDKRLLKTPAIAVGQVRKELLHMGKLAFENYKRSLDMLITGNLGEHQVFADTEKHINDYNSYISSFLVKLSLQDLAETDEKKVSSYYHVASDAERIGDYAENIVEYAQKMVEDKAQFSEQAKAEILEMDEHISKLFKYVEKVFGDIDTKYIPDVEREEAATDEVCIKMQEAHLKRATDGGCTPEAGAIYLQLAINMERIVDHMHNIANSVKSYHPY